MGGESPSPPWSKSLRIGPWKNRSAQVSKTGQRKENLRPGQKRETANGTAQRKKIPIAAAKKNQTQKGRALTNKPEKKTGRERERGRERASQRGSTGLPTTQSAYESFIEKNIGKSSTPSISCSIEGGKRKDRKKEDCKSVMGRKAST